MKTNEFGKCLYLIGYYWNEDEALISDILEADIVKDYLQPFSKELNNNLLTKETIEAKVDLIKYYIFEFWELQGFYKEYNEILFTGGQSGFGKSLEHTNETGTKRKLDDFESYVILSWELFDMMFNELQLSCKKYKIDFFKACLELNFSTYYFQGGTTIAPLEIQNVNFPQQKTEQEVDNEFTVSTIENWLFEFKKLMSENDYNSLVSSLIMYFEIGTFPNLTKTIQINGRPNKKLFGWHLNRIFEAKGKRVEQELLRFAKQNISLYCKDEFDENNFIKSNLYKYFTTQTK